MDKADSMERETLSPELVGMLSETVEAFAAARREYQPRMAVQTIGTVVYVGAGIARVKGLQGVRADELIQFPENLLGLAFNVDPAETGVVLLDAGKRLSAGSEVERTGRVLDVPAGDSVLGRVVDAQGRPLDGRGRLQTSERWHLERAAPGIMDRLPVTEPLQTGIKVVDALIPIGRGQRELIIGDRQTGKTAVAVDTMINQRHKNVVCIYCAVGKRASSVAKVISDLRQYEAMEYSAVVVATEEDPPGLQFITPYAAAAMGEFFAARGQDVLIVFDDLSNISINYGSNEKILDKPTPP